MAELRAVLDTNSVLAAFHSRDPRSPNREILERWRRGQFVLLFSADTLLEYAEKLTEHGVSAAKTSQLLARISLAGEEVLITSFHFRHYPADADDVAFLLCALNGHASHLVTYDDHLLSLQTFYAREITICLPLNFLAVCRGIAGEVEPGNGGTP